MSLVVALFAGMFGLSGFALFLGFLVASLGGQTDAALLLFSGAGGCIAVLWLLSLTGETPSPSPAALNITTPGGTAMRH